jgi:photosystem II stability/assembly factor-like uncharacterized protein
MTAVAIPPRVTVLSPAGTVLAGTDGMGLWRSTDAGAHWERGALGAVTRVNAIAFDPSRPDVVYAVGVIPTDRGWIGAVHRSTDAGIHWLPTALQRGRR